MKKFFLVEANTNYHSLFCYEMTETGYLKYERAEDFLFNNVDRAQFFGNLNALCHTQESMQSPPLELAEPDMERDRR